MAANQLNQFKLIKEKLVRFMMMYEFALKEVGTKIEILQEEFQFLHEYNPIEHTKTRIKSPESIMKKIIRKGGVRSLDEIKETIKDIAGVRITCSFIEDIYKISQMLQNQSDLRIVTVKDYIRHPKPNGYKSLHMLVEVPVFMSDREESVYVEIQIRTIAMDFWASLEHKIFYKYDESVPPRLLAELKAAADAAYELDQKMEKLHREIMEMKSARQSDEAELKLLMGDQHITIPDNLLKLIQPNEE